MTETTETAEPMCSVTKLYGGCGPRELEALRDLERAWAAAHAAGDDLDHARKVELLAAIAAARETEGEPLPGWADLSDLDKGAALLFLHKVDYEGEAEAVAEYPVAYFDDPALIALPPRLACEHALALIDDTPDPEDDEHARLYDLALAAQRRR